jgi:thioredoxin-like negative regulator of GroEL
MTEENVIDLNDSNWEQNIEKNKKPVVVMFYSDMCPYCQQMEPHFYSYAKEFEGKAIFGRINVMNNPTTATRYGVMGTPTFKFFCNGKPVQELVGAIYPASLKKTVQESLVNGPECVQKTTWKSPEITGYA